MCTLVGLTLPCDQRKIPLHHFLPLDSRNQESAHPMVKNGAMGFFSDHNSSSTGSIPVSPKGHGSTREQIIPSEPARTFKLMRMTGSKKYSPVGTKPSPMWGSIYDQRKIPLHHFLPLDSRNQESETRFP
jgi:hypothetical protein